MSLTGEADMNELQRQIEMLAGMVRNDSAAFEGLLALEPDQDAAFMRFIVYHQLSCWMAARRAFCSRLK